MDLGPHAAFIVTAYAAAGVVLLGLAVWVLLDYRTQRRKLADLETRGMTRRSERAKPASP
jgi:heme exporter protein D